MKYRNVRDGRVIERPTEDEWLEASSGWERVDEDGPEAWESTLMDGLGDVPAASDNEEEDD